MLAFKFTCLLILICKTFSYASGYRLENSTLKEEPNDNAVLKTNLKKGRSLSDVKVNTQVLTIVTYKDSQVYIYSALSNENENKNAPRKWIFYFVPISVPSVTSDAKNKWAFNVKKEVRVNLVLSNEDVKKLAKIEIMKK